MKNVRQLKRKVLRWAAPPSLGVCGLQVAVREILEPPSAPVNNKK